MATHSSILAWRILWTEEPATDHGVAKELDTSERPSALEHTLWLRLISQSFSLGFPSERYTYLLSLPSSCTLAPVKLLYRGEKRQKTQTDRNLSLFSFVLGDMLEILDTWLNTKRGENKINKIQESLDVGKLSRLLRLQEGCLGWGEVVTEVKGKRSDIWVMSEGIRTTSCTGFLITAIGLRSRDGSDTN